MTDIIDILVKEHENIYAFTNELEQKMILFMNTNEIDFEFMRNSIHFIRTYADAKHHKKEEDILFKAMLENQGQIAENLIKFGMLMEHEMARFHVFELENALNNYEKEKSDLEKIKIITNAMGYVYLLRRHIDKENGVVYPFAKRGLDEKLMQELSKEAEDFDKSYNDYK